MFDPLQILTEDKWMGKLLSTKPTRRMTVEDMANILENKSRLFRTLREEFDLKIIT